MLSKSLIGTLLLGAGLIWQTAAASGLQLVSPPTPMPAFKSASLGGSSTSDADLRNKVTIIRFWASW
ncbi:MAG: hypothetical protein FJY44_01385 [Betaproteobacteria bacterium]|nr:hypothetical protein [Betaproteobacteria bacterium]